MSTAIEIKSEFAKAIGAALERANLSTSEFSRRINTSRSSVRRMLDAKNTSVTLATMVKAADALDLTIQLGVKPASPARLKTLLDQHLKIEKPADAKKNARKIMEAFYGMTSAEIAKNDQRLNRAHAKG